MTVKYFLYQSAIILLVSILLLSSCTDMDTPLSPAERNPAELCRQVTAAFVELNNYTKALNIFRMNYGCDPESIEELIPYLKAQAGIRPIEVDQTDTSLISTERYDMYTWWRFDFTKNQNVVISFEAQSLSSFIEGADHIISYNVSTGEFSGYGLDRVDPNIYIFLIGEFLAPNIYLITTEGTISQDQWKKVNTVRQVNWAANQIGYVRNAVRIYWQDFGEYPLHIDSLTVLEYLTLEQPAITWWTFDLQIVLSQHVQMPYVESIYAVSTENMAGNCHDTLIFNYWDRHYSGEWAKWKSPFVGP